jgi:hypothetical protein
VKSQAVRLADVFLIGPLMVWGGYELKKSNRTAGNALMALGVGTALYNGYNYRQIQRGNRIAGGKAAGRKPASFDPAQLKLGIREEMEHTRDPAIAREIAMDHLVEDPAYYTKLKRAGL